MARTKPETLRQCSHHRHAQLAQGTHRHHHEGERHQQQGHRTARQPPFSQYQQGQGDETTTEHDEMRVAELTGKHPDAGKEVLTAARHPKEFRQLRHGDAERGAGFKPHQNRFADEIDQSAQPQRPRQHAHTGDKQGSQSGDARPAHGIAIGHARHGYPDEQ